MESLSPYGSEKRNQVAKLMIAGIDQYNFIVNPCGEEYDEVMNFEKDFKRSILSWTQILENRLDLQYQAAKRKLDPLIDEIHQ